MEVEIQDSGSTTGVAPRQASSSRGHCRRWLQHRNSTDDSPSGDRDRARLAEAEDIFRDAYARDPFHYGLFIQSLLAQGKHTEAVQVGREAIRLYPHDDSGSPYYALGMALLGQGSHNEAIEAYNKGLRPDTPNVVSSQY